MRQPYRTEWAPEQIDLSLFYLDCLTFDPSGLVPNGVDLSNFTGERGT